MQIGKCRLPDAISYIPTTDTVNEDLNLSYSAMVMLGAITSVHKNVHFYGVSYYSMKFKTI